MSIGMPNNSTIMGAAPAGKLGIVSGMLALNRTLGQTTGIAIMGALGAALTIANARPTAVTSSTEALPPAQAAALQDTFIVIAGVILAAILLALWGAVKGSRRPKTAA